MPRQKPFDKRTATTFAVVNRPQHDPRIHDDEASSHVFTEISGPSKRQPKIKQRGDLEEEFGLAGGLKGLRDNEGEAAEHGIYYDDTDYDYMQHMREIGAGGGESTWVEAQSAPTKSKGKQRLEDALRDVKLDDNASMASGFSSVSRASRASQPSWRTYEQQQDIPDELQGFQPDMDPRLREVLEALEDDAYVDYEDDIFGELTGEGDEEIDRDEWEAGGLDDEEGWESDDTTKPVKEYRESVPSNDEQQAPAPSLDDGDLMAALTKSKGTSDDPISKPKQPAPAPPSSIALTTDTQLGRRKKRKGALTSSTGFSMSSSALARTEPLSILDSRFDKLAEQYMGDLDEADEEELDDNISLASGATGMSNMSRASKWGGTQTSEAPSLVPAGHFESAGFNSVMDDFLTGSGGAKGRRMKKAGKQGFWGQQSGMEQLDEIRKGLGPARVKQRG